jgi:hypothetical protein
MTSARSCGESVADWFADRCPNQRAQLNRGPPPLPSAEIAFDASLCLVEDRLAILGDSFTVDIGAQAESQWE